MAGKLFSLSLRPNGINPKSMKEKCRVTQEKRDLASYITLQECLTMARESASAVLHSPKCCRARSTRRGSNTTMSSVMIRKVVRLDEGARRCKSMGENLAGKIAVCESV